VPDDLNDISRVDYFEAVLALRKSPKEIAVFVCHFGGSASDVTDLIEFWNGLTDMVPWQDHRRFTRAWLATCAFSRDAAKERDILRAFIWGAARTLNLTKEER